MSLYQLFDQFCIDFCQAWSLDESSFIVRQTLTLIGLGMMFSIGLHFYHAIFDLLTALFEWLFKKIIKIIKSR